MKNGSKTINISSRSTVIATGGIESIKILLQLDKYSKDFSNPNIGKGFYDHPAIHHAFTIYTDTLEKYWISRWRAKNRKFREMLGLSISENLRRQFGVVDGCLVFPKITNNKEKEINKLFKLDFTLYWSNHKKNASEIILKSFDEKRDMISINWDINEIDRKTVATHLGLIIEELSAVCPNDIMKINTDMLSSETFLENVEKSSHHQGGANMSLSPKDGVVDANCKVHGLGKLYVLSSSIFPTTDVGNPTLLIAAFACRLAQRLEDVFDRKNTELGNGIFPTAKINEGKKIQKLFDFSAGFHAPEHSGIWLSNYGQIHTKYSGKKMLKLLLHGYHHEEYRQSLMIVADGEKLYENKKTPNGYFEIDLIAEGEKYIKFYAARAISPKRLHGGADTRKLGYFFKNILVY